jgi:hypothetical protein
MIVLITATDNMYINRREKRLRARKEELYHILIIL